MVKLSFQFIFSQWLKSLRGNRLNSQFFYLKERREGLTAGRLLVRSRLAKPRKGGERRGGRRLWERVT